MRENFGFQWHITDKCNNRCAHCYQSDFSGDAELPIDALCNIADVIMRGVKGDVCVNITGGEPFLYRGGGNDSVFELAQHLSAYDNCVETSIITNAANIDDAIIARIKSTPKLSQIKVSLESHNARINDGIRGAGNFAQTTRNIAKLAQAEISVTLMATLSKRNYGCVLGLCELAISLGARAVMFERYVPLGHGKKIEDEILTSREWDEVLRLICEVTNMNFETSRDALLPFKAFIVDVSRGALGDDCALQGAPCCLGASSMAVMPNGTVYPCRRVPVPVGKLPSDDMKTILNTLAKATLRCTSVNA